jgi:glycosyltransferase involved in cell wall biosynthesis
MGESDPGIELSQGLSIVIPFFNEGKNTEKALKCAVVASRKCHFPIEFLLVNDGSNDGYPKAENINGATLIKLNHAGRISTRLAGAQHAQYSNVLFIDARVWMHSESLLNLESLIAKHPDSQYWNGFVQSLNLHLPQVSIWETLVRVGWSRMYSENKTIHFGLKDFDQYPKGTSIFVASKTDWIEGLRKLSLLESGSRVAISDDTALIREFASKSDIWIDTSFSADYSPRTSMQAFLKNARYRGQTFVDSYWTSNTIFGKLVKYLPPTMLTSCFGIGLYSGLTGAFISVAGSIAFVEILFFTYSLRLWKDKRRATKEAAVLFPMLFSFGFGFASAYANRVLTIPSWRVRRR